MLKELKSRTGSDDWQTPQYILDVVDAFYRHSWFDPFPIGGRETNPISEWPIVFCRVYCNPPFSEYLKWVKSSDTLFQEQIWMMHHDSSTKRQRILTERSSAICLLKDRVKFIDPRTGKPSGTSPGKSQTLIYIGDNPQGFAEYFMELGEVFIR